MRFLKLLVPLKIPPMSDSNSPLVGCRTAQRFETEFNEFLESAAIRHGLTIRTNRRFASGGDSVEFRVRAGPNFMMRPEFVAYRRTFVWAAEYFGFLPSDLDRIFTHENTSFQLFGIDLRFLETPIVALNLSENRYVYLPTNAVRFNSSASGDEVRISIGIGSQETELHL